MLSYLIFGHPDPWEKMGSALCRGASRQERECKKKNCEHFHSETTSFLL
jgi:hypothetical protein